MGSLRVYSLRVIFILSGVHDCGYARKVVIYIMQSICDQEDQLLGCHTWRNRHDISSISNRNRNRNLKTFKALLIKPSAPGHQLIHEHCDESNGGFPKGGQEKLTGASSTCIV